MARKKNTFARASVIIPAYNAQKTLKNCLDALLNQTILPNEIIVVDDGSTDETKSVAESYSLVKVISQQNQGPAKARNAGAQKAKSDTILFLDSDCIPEKNWLEEMIKSFEDENVVGVQGAYKTKQKSLTARFDQLDIEYRYERMKRSKKLDWVGSYSAGYRKEIFLKEGGFDETFPKASGEDAELSYRLAEKGHRLVFASKAIVYHTHPEDVWKFLNVEYFRAYWRMRMYIKHPLKAVRDSYTPHGLKLAVFFGAVLIAGTAISIVSFIFQFHQLPNLIALLSSTIIVSIVGIFLANLTFLFFVFRRDMKVGLFSILLVLSRTISFGFGIFSGFLDEKVRA